MRAPSAKPVATTATDCDRGPVTILEEVLPQVVGDLNRLDLPWALVGGLAVCARARPRPTADIDIAVSLPDDATANMAVDALIDLDYRLTESIVHDQTDRLATVRLLAAVDGKAVVVDLFFASSGVEAEVVEAAELLAIRPGLVIPVASIGHLIAVKLCWRQSDKRDRDLHVLIEQADEVDREDARQLIAVITERGYDRGRNLSSALESWLSAP